MSLAPLTETQGSLPKPLRPIWELLRQRSIPAINQGLEAFSALSETDSATADRILDTTGVFPRPSSRSAAAHLQPGCRFTRTDDGANPYLMYALMGILSRCWIPSRGSELRQAIQFLDIQCPALPELQGFTGLMELRLLIYHPYSSNEEPYSYSLADQIDSLPSLEKLELTTGNQTVECLDWMPAPKLRVLKASDIGLRSIEGLGKIQSLESVDLSCNRNLSDLSPLCISAGRIRRLNLFRTSVDGLGAIPELNELDELNINDCEAITSLESLSHIRICQEQIGLRLDNLASLRPMPMLAGESLHLTLPRVTSLDGLELAQSLRKLGIESMTMLTDISALEKLSGLQRFSISDCDQLQSLQTLEHLSELVEVYIEDCRQLSSLPTAWPKTLRVLKIGRCPIEAVGQLPAEFSGELDLSDCRHLKTLKGLENCTGINAVRVDSQPRDLSALATLPNTWLCLDFEHHQQELSDDLMETLAAVPKCRLRVLNLRRSTNEMLAPLSRLPHLQSLDISDLNVDNVSFVMGLEELELLKVAPRSKLSQRLGGCTFDSATEIAKLKLSLLGMG